MFNVFDTAQNRITCSGLLSLLTYLPLITIFLFTYEELTPYLLR